LKLKPLIERVPGVAASAATPAALSLPCEL
jgi:hypothetical protein